ncbi:hypothetical protein B0T13DRAFT_513480 [Neurospora crassa]|nr:hypothetical protein B0T13DRAFT_513480 [Neurospora crassa]CAD11339.1 putative protein [Neurospora crassa]
MFARISTASALTARQTLVAASARRTIASTASLKLKESSNTDPDPQAYEKHKQESLKKQKEGKGQWKPELASNSEENVKADRLSDAEFAEASKRELEKHTKN